MEVSPKQRNQSDTEKNNRTRKCTPELLFSDYIFRFEMTSEVMITVHKTEYLCVYFERYHTEVSPKQKIQLERKSSI